MMKLNFAWGSLARGRKPKPQENDLEVDTDEPGSPKGNDGEPKGEDFLQSCPSTTTGTKTKVSSFSVFNLKPLIRDTTSSFGRGNKSSSEGRGNKSTISIKSRKAPRRADSMAVLRNSSEKEDAALLRRHGYVVLASRCPHTWLNKAKQCAGKVLEEEDSTANGYYDIDLRQAEEGFYLQSSITDLWVETLQQALGKNDDKDVYQVRRCGLLAAAEGCRKSPWPVRPDVTRSRESAVAILIGMSRDKPWTKPFGVLHVFVPLVELVGNKEVSGPGSLTIKPGGILVCDDATEHPSFMEPRKKALTQPCLYWTYERWRPSKTALRKMMLGYDDDIEEEEEPDGANGVAGRFKNWLVPTAASHVLHRSPRTKSWWERKIGKKPLSPEMRSMSPMVPEGDPPGLNDTTSSGSTAAETVPSNPNTPASWSSRQEERIAYRERERQRFWESELKNKNFQRLIPAAHNQLSQQPAPPPIPLAAAIRPPPEPCDSDPQKNLKPALKNHQKVSTKVAGTESEELGLFDLPDFAAQGTFDQSSFTDPRTIEESGLQSSFSGLGKGVQQVLPNFQPNPPANPKSGPTISKHSGRLGGLVFQR